MTAGPDEVAVVVVGAGPAGLAAATELGRRGVGPVLVVDREAEAGGVPRHCPHPGFGVQDLRRNLSGPAYARRLVDRARAAGADVVVGTTVVSVAPVGDGTVSVGIWGPSGPRTVLAGRVVLATGVRERPRAARLVAGDRPAGVFTTGQLQQWVHLRHLPVGRRAVVVGAEHVSYSAVLTLREAGVTAVAMVTSEPRHQTVPVAGAWAPALLRVPLLTGSEVTAVRGHGRVRAVEVTDSATGTVRTYAADTVVFTGGWIPDHELARRSGVALDPATLGPLVDGAGRTDVPGVSATGNLVHPAETAGVCALAGRSVGAAVARSLRGVGPVVTTGVPLTVTPPLAWAVPGRVDPVAPPDRIRLRTAAGGPARTVVARQDGHELGRHRVRHTTPNRSLSAPGRLVAGADPSGGAVTLSLE